MLAMVSISKRRAPLSEWFGKYDLARSVLEVKEHFIGFVIFVIDAVACSEAERIMIYNVGFILQRYAFFLTYASVSPTIAQYCAVVCKCAYGKHL